MNSTLKEILETKKERNGYQVTLDQLKTARNRTYNYTDKIYEMETGIWRTQKESKIREAELQTLIEMANEMIEILRADYQTQI